MQIQVSTDNHIKGSDEFFQKVSAEVERGLSRFAEQITRVEVHLSDVNGPKGGGDDKRCLLEARLAGRQPIAVTHEAATVDEAIVEACEKMERSIESLLGRLDPKGQTSFGGDQVI
ncbi:HPF/RaiA family ribosome-associated protein [Singulisphaera acidiphila]|uniref:Sigma 54 modulation protein / S30EA ribosomal protein n=1 Tax=Singulisphaera acidiphila (strain ATCC BAA-1392 / DSM 18658 / VKM B-2454 / MOB10) TaxID=886293 RepID=L0D8D1_SINAD|nr:HPF/RaiA family ribosome-associated protein [Singulisphaera acidiphila]AGA25669.1 Sigma 54 modulation protein / S30EA ribosomal protein [Singulisphaera acidiphila DSM 18658]